MFQPSNAFGDPVAFRTIFFEEAQEHLANVESILLRMDTDAPHPDDLNAIFRAVHSIKGSAAMLGCTEIAALTHLQENLLDLLRKGERPIVAADVDAMLKAGDVLRLQVLHRRGSVPDAPDAAGRRSDAARARGPAVVRRRGRPVRPGDAQLPREARPAGPADRRPGPGHDADRPVRDGHGRRTVRRQRRRRRVRFDVLLQGAAADLQSVLALVVAPELIALETLGAAAQPQPAAPVAPRPPPCCSRRGRAAATRRDEFFVDPAEFKRAGPCRRAAAGRRAPAQAAPSTCSSRRELKSAARDAAAVTVRHAEQFSSARRPRAAAPAGAAPHAAPAAGASTQTAHDTTFIRVATEKIDLLVNLVGELVITEAMLRAMAPWPTTPATAATAPTAAGRPVRATRATCRKRCSHPHAADLQRVLALPAGGARAVQPPGQARRAEGLGRGHRARSRPDREDLRSADAPGAQRGSTTGWRRRRNAAPRASRRWAPCGCAPASVAATS
jgi:two-component system chemotaxis sensor kinase CheA